MKIKTEDGFRPITITIESKDEARDLFAAIAMSTIGGAREKMRSFKLGDEGINGRTVDTIWQALVPIVGYDSSRVNA